MSALPNQNRTFRSWRTRAWTISLPLHLVAFALLYIATVELTQSEVFSTAADVARAALSQEVKEFEISLPESSVFAVVGAVHPHRDFFSVHDSGLGIDLFDPSGAPVATNSHVPPAEAQGVRDFLRSELPEKSWLATVGERFILKSLRRIEAQETCAACHRLGQLLGVLSANLDLTPQIQRVRERLRLNLAVLLVGWAVAIVLFAMLVERTVRRSARHLQADFTAADGGKYAATDKQDESPVLDPVAAELHHSLRAFLQRHRKRETELASRMVHTNQLASLGQLAAGLAHEIKNPLAGVSCTLELLQEQVQDDAHKKRCAVMLEELGRVDQTLALLLSSARPAPLRIAEADLYTVLDEIRRFLTPALRRKKIELQVEIASGVSSARIDAAKIRQVLINLINNAADAIEYDGRIMLRSAPFPAGGGLVITVADDGPGIADDDKKQIFEPFFTTKSAGTGLGLTISTTLIEQHGGRLDVESAPGRGTTFVLVLPQSAQRVVPRTDGPVATALRVSAGD